MSLVNQHCEVCQRELEDGDCVEETVWNEALTVCSKCEEILNQCIIHRNQIQKGR